MDRIDELRERESNYLNKIYDMEETGYNPDEDLLQLLPNVVTSIVAGVIGTITVFHFTTDLSMITLGVPMASTAVGFFTPQAVRKIKLCYYNNKLNNNRREQVDINSAKSL